MGSSNCICKEKYDKIRICADYLSGLNDSLKKINYPFQTVEKNFCKFKWLTPVRFVRILFTNTSGRKVGSFINY